MLSSPVKKDSWQQRKIKWDEIDRYMQGSRDFIDDHALFEALALNPSPDPARIREIIAKSLEKARGEKTVAKAIRDGMSAVEAFEKFGIM
mgnify:CR=1 FL=1